MNNHGSATIDTPVHFTQQQIADWMAVYISDLCSVPLDKISHTVSLRKYGLDSATAVTLSGDLMDWLKCDIDPSLLYEHPTIAQASAHIMTLIEVA